MKFIDLETQYLRIKDKIHSGIINVLDSGAYIMGSDVAKLEQRLADHSGVKYCVTCSSGTDALLMPLMAWNIGPGDAVFTSPFTFIATAEVINLLGAVPVFVDIDKDTFNIDANDLEKKIEKVIYEGKLTPKVIIPVDLFGLLSDYEKIQNIAEKYGLLVLEDAAQSYGASQNGKKSGSFGNSAATSFYPAKPLGCYGDGGAIFTDEEEHYKILNSIRVHGQGSDKYNNERIGINGRLDTLQAAILNEKMEIFDEEVELRNKVATKYSSLLNNIKTPYIPEGNTSVWAQYSVLADSTEHRTFLMNKLKENDIPSVIYYPKPLHLQDAFKNLGYSTGDFPVSEDISSRIFSLPMHPYLKDEEIEKICSVIG
jgi:dTDP-4-amino-4,6-dideoxygalactose transaminase